VLRELDKEERAARSPDEEDTPVVGGVCLGATVGEVDGAFRSLEHRRRVHTAVVNHHGDIKRLRTFPNNKRNLYTDLPPFLTRQSHERFTLVRVAAVYLVFNLFLACHGHRNMLLDTKGCFRVPPELIILLCGLYLNDLLTMLK
jgi:hypothetical protein